MIPGGLNAETFSMRPATRDTAQKRLMTAAEQERD